MVNYLLLILSIFCASLKSIFSKISNKSIDADNNIYTFNFYLFAIGGLMIFVFGFKDLATLTIETCIFAVIYSFFTLLSQIMLIKATNTGDVALSSLFYSSGFLVPIIGSAIIYNEIISPRQGIGIALLMISFIISVKLKKKETSEKKNNTVKWLIYATLAMLAAGTVGLLQKIFRMSSLQTEMNGFLIVTFAIITLAMFILMPKNKVKKKKGFFSSAIVIGICMGGANILNLYLAGVLPSVIVFSALNGGSIVVSALGANLILKEKLSIRKKIGILIGIVSILLIAV